MTAPTPIKKRLERLSGNEYCEYEKPSSPSKRVVSCSESSEGVAESEGAGDSELFFCSE